MAILSPTFVAGVIALLYLSSFVLFAIIRIVTGISIQRIGYLSLRRLAYTPKDGFQITVRGLGINLHRPTFAQPTWISVVITELAVSVDLVELEKEKGDTRDRDTESIEHKVNGVSEHAVEVDSSRESSRSRSKRSKSWEQLTQLKERIKRLHRKINWIRLVDVVATNCAVVVKDVGTVQLGSFTMAVDTRRKMVDRDRMFSHNRKSQINQRPAEWMLTIRSVLFTPEGQESLEVLDFATLNIHGLLYKELDGLRDAAISLKLGRVHIPLSDIQTCLESFKSCRKNGKLDQDADVNDATAADIMVELDRPGSSGSQDHNIAQTVSDSKEFFSSILRGIKEVQFAVSYIGMTSKISSVQAGSTPLYLNASMKEVGIDVHRLDPRTPAHRMYFGSRDVAHQALVAALSISVGIDEGLSKLDRLLYIPMATTTVRTTLPSKTVQFGEDKSADERNANMLFANMVVTSPSIDLDPRHLPMVLAMLQSKPNAKKESRKSKRVLISRLLPKSSVKISMHEPVIRISLPVVESSASEDDFDLLISSVSSVSLDVESSHSAVGENHELHYALSSTFRVQSHDLYYQTTSGNRFNLLRNESMELKVAINASPEVHVVVAGTFQTFSVHMIRPEISDGVRQIVKQLRTDVEPTKKARPKTSRDPNFIRAVPDWLLHLQLQAYDFSAEVAGVDGDISHDTRGLALQLESWSAEYRAQRVEPSEGRQTRRRAGSRTLTPDTELLNTPSLSPRRNSQHPTDGRRLALHVRGLEGFVVEAADRWEADPFLAVPRFEVAFSTSSDNQGPIFHIHSHVKTLLLQYSLYRHYAVGVAAMVIKKSFMHTAADKEESEARAAVVRKKLHEQDRLTPMPSPYESDADSQDYSFTARETITVDFKAVLIQVKARLPANVPLMLQIYGIEAGRHRWSSPFLSAKLARLYTEAPKINNVWARIVSLKALRADLRETKRKFSNGETQEEKLIDIDTEAIRLGVPHQLVLHTIFDNIVNTVKASAQLHHRFKTGTNDYILVKHPEGPKRVPRISIRSRALLFEVEDGPFEWKLGSIYRIGLIEQRQRLAREEAFNVKAKKIREEQPNSKRSSSRYRAKSTQRGQSKSKNEDDSDEDTPRRRGRSHSRRGKRRMRYDPEGVCGISGKAKISIEEAELKMKEYNAQSWKKRIDHCYAIQNSGMKDLRGVFWGKDQLPDDMEEVENILEVPQRPGLMGALISDVHITIDKPSFPSSQLPEFLHRIGKGMPYDMQYSLLIPLHVQIDMGETRLNLRDYPLPLLHVPALKSGQSARLPSWSLKTDFVIAEEFRGPESTRHVEVEIVPPRDPRPKASNAGRFAIDVRRTVSPVKTYSDLNIDINTSLPTRITWGASYQPAIQDMMMVIEGFTKPQRDPSDRTGFWDKIRLSFHSRVLVAWKGDGDVHLMLKGTRDPYAVTGNGAGFLMCWRNDVRWSIWRENDPKKFMTVDSGDYILAIPDYSHQARGNEKSGRDDESVSSSDNYKHGAIFKKVVMKLSGNVQWLAGLVFERDVAKGKRSFEFEPHYNVVLKEPHFAKAPPGEEYDAFRGFRSHHIHLSVAVKSPSNRDWSLTNSEPSTSYNTVHLTPRFFTHFFAWWSMFGGTMSLPIRQGPLWPGIEKSSKKFGRHLATIEYNLLFAPLFLSHIYKHKEVEDYTNDVVAATGLKIRLDSFMLDMHQRREEFNTQDKGRKTQTKTTGMKINKAQLDLLNADIRAVSASIAGTTTEDLQKASAPTLQGQHDGGVTDLSKFEIPDNDFSWIDMDDFVELDWILPSEANPETKIMPLAFAPRFTYFRQTDHGGTIAGDPDRKSDFGDVPTHYCIMSQDDDPRRVQCQLIQDRLDQLSEQKKNHAKYVSEAESRLMRDDGKSASLRAEYEELSTFSEKLHDKKLFLESMLRRMSMRVHTDNKRAVPDGDADRDSDGMTPHPKELSSETEGIDSNPSADFISDFNNRFVIHNIQLKWNNSLRNTLLRYIHQVSQRRGFVYYLSRRAVKFILDIVDEQNKAKQSKNGSNGHGSESPSDDAASSAPRSQDDNASNVEERIKELVSDAKKFVKADDPKHEDSNNKVSAENLSGNLGKDYVPQNTYHLRLIAPQIQLQSEKSPESVVLVTAKGMEAKVVEVMDKDRIFDDVSGLVQRRFSVAMDSTQFFVTQQKWFSTQLVSMYSGNRYGAPVGSSWPPWVQMEVMFDFEVDPFGFKRVVQKTSASLRYDKYNNLRLKFNDEVGDDKGPLAESENVESRMDHLWVEFPHIRAICDSEQYYALYIIVLDLLLYSEPLEKQRSERLEKIMLASDFSDLSGAPEMVETLQDRIRQLDEIKTQFQIHSKSLDKKGWEDRILLEQDLAGCSDELFFMMKAITTSQRKYEGSQNNGLLRWNISSQQIVWHLMREKNQPLMEFQLKNAEYDRTDNSDGSHVNLLQIGKVVGLNLLPEAIYPEMVKPYTDISGIDFDEDSDQKMFRMYWYMLEAIAGIPVVDHFEVNLFPMRIQLEREVATKLFEYIFPVDEKDKERLKNHSGYLRPGLGSVQDEDEDAKARKPMSVQEAERQDTNSTTKAGALATRLRPTMSSHDPTRTPKTITSRASHEEGSSGIRSFLSSRQSSRRPPSLQNVNRKVSTDSMRSTGSQRPNLQRSSTNASTADTASVNSSKNKRFSLHRSNKQEEKKPSDDLTKMIDRASNYMTLAHVKIPSVVLCLSYKGKGGRNLEDVHDLVFRLPDFEYRNKTWSNLDLALALKKDVIKALISHTGAIIGNKFSKHRPNTAVQSRLRELASSSTLLTPTGQDTSSYNSDASSTLGTSPSDARRSERSHSPRRSFQSNRDSLARTDSSESIVSRDQGPSNHSGFPNRRSMAMTPIRSVSDALSTTDGPDSEGRTNSFMTDTKLGRKLTVFGDRIRDRESRSDSASPQPSANNLDDTEDTQSHKGRKGLLGKLGSLKHH